MSVRLLLVLACLLSAAAPLAAAPPDPLDALRRRLDELSRAGAELPAALDALHDLERRLDAIAQQVGELSGDRAADVDVRRAIDDLRAEATRIERQLADTQARLVELAERPPPVELGCANGLFLRAPLVEAVLNAAVQPQYEGIVRTGADHDSSTFELHHAQLQLSVALLKVVELRAMFDFGAAFLVNAAAPVRDLYLEVRPLSWLAVRGGQFKVPFGRQRLVSSLRQAFVERSLPTLAFTVDRDLGVLVEGAFFAQRLLVQAAVTNGGEGIGAVRNENLDLAYCVRVVAQPLGPLALVEGDPARSPDFRFSFGGAARYNLVPTDLPTGLNDLDHNGLIDNVEVISANAELAARWRGFAVEAEYFYRRERSGFGRPPREYFGGYGQVSAMLWRGLGLGARFSYAEPHELEALRVGIVGTGVPKSGIEAAGVVNYYFWQQNLRAQLGYAFRRDGSSDPVDTQNHEGHVIDVQVQAGF